jgi:hypothetical membrane protein
LPLYVLLIAAIMLIGLPLAGVAAAGLDISTFLEFPPLTRYVPHADFSWGIFISIFLVDLLLIGAVIYVFQYRDRSQVEMPPSSVSNLSDLSGFPWWGWAGVLICVSGTILAWTRFEWFRDFQQHTFTLPWAGYILVANALSVKRSSRSILTENPGRFMLLFPVSAVFWWFFEYLNRYVQNWYYLGIDDFGSIEYTVFASISFSTVLPAVLSTHGVLMTFPALSKRLTHSRSLTISRPRFLALAVLAVSSLGLSLIGIYPDYLFPLLWVSPLLLVSSLQTLFGYDNIFSSVRSGDWRNIVGLALAALICGFFWEMWNYFSLAKWEYAVPFVNRFYVFEMPVLGFGGYLPFGLECLIAVKLIQISSNK